MPRERERGMDEMERLLQIRLRVWWNFPLFFHILFSLPKRDVGIFFLKKIREGVGGCGGGD